MFWPRDHTLLAYHVLASQELELPRGLLGPLRVTFTWQARRRLPRAPCSKATPLSGKTGTLTTRSVRYEARRRFHRRGASLASRPREKATSLDIHLDTGRTLCLNRSAQDRSRRHTSATSTSLVRPPTATTRTRASSNTPFARLNCIDLSIALFHRPESELLTPLQADVEKRPSGLGPQEDPHQTNTAQSAPYEDVVDPGIHREADTITPAPRRRDD